MLLKQKNLKTVETYTQNNDFRMSGAASITNELYLLFYKDNENNDEILFLKHSLSLKTWDELELFYEEYLYSFCMCSFVESIFLMGGRYDHYNNFNLGNSCVIFDTISKKWKEIAKMNDYRIHAASTLFEGRVVISGGFNAGEGYLRTVEAYDHAVDKWSYMPSLVNESSEHELIAISNKLFAIACGEDSDIYEVYDSICKKFNVLNSHPPFFDGSHHTSISVRGKIIFFRSGSSKVAIYNVEKNEWSEKTFEVTENICNFYSLKIPSLRF